METGTTDPRQAFPAVTMEPAQGSAGHSASSEQAANVECVNGQALTDVTPEHRQGFSVCRTSAAPVGDLTDGAARRTQLTGFSSSSTPRGRFFVVKIRTEGACW